MKQEPQTNQGRLYIWGKGYPAVKQLSKDIRCVGAGENHFIFTTSNYDLFGAGSNKFGQLGLPELRSENELTKLNLAPGGAKFVVKSVHCGAEHTFFINDKNQVYSMGFNIKGQLGLGNFQSSNKPKLVLSLLPSGVRNPKALSPALQKSAKPPIVQLLQKFDLQVKIQQEPIQNILLLEQDQHIIDISCGSVFTVALSSKGRVFTCGYMGSSVPSGSANDEYLDRGKFKLLQMPSKISQIHSGLSGAAALTREGAAYIWGIFGDTIYNVPKKATTRTGDESILKPTQQQKIADVRVGDEFACLLTIKGEVFTFGQNLYCQLGCETEAVARRHHFEKVKNLPPIKAIQVGRNHCFALAVNNELWGWGSNRYSQIGYLEGFSLIMLPKNLQMVVSDHSKLVLSSYTSIILSPERISFNSSTLEKTQSANKNTEQTIRLSEYKKLLHDYQVLKSLNLTLLDKTQPPKRVNQEVQTQSKFEIDGVTKYRQFNTNVEIEWNELQIIDRINEGGYGVIYKAKWREIMVVCKKFKIENGDVSLRDFLSECNAMEAVRHPNIVMFLGAVTKPKNYSIILEYCSRGSLWSYLQNQQYQITWEEKKRFAIEIAQGVLYLHSCKPPILHRDLKSLNIFLDQHLRIKIGDFGWTKTLDQYMTNKIGTYQWMAPEVIGNKPYTEKADVFSYSIILWEIASREPPYRNITGAKVSEAVLNNDLRPQIPKKTPESFARLMKKCWDSDPLKRPNFREIIRELEIMKL